MNKWDSLFITPSLLDGNKPFAVIDNLFYGKKKANLKNFIKQTPSFRKWKIPYLTIMDCKLSKELISIKRQIY